MGADVVIDGRKGSATWQQGYLGMGVGTRELVPFPKIDHLAITIEGDTPDRWREGSRRPATVRAGTGEAVGEAAHAGAGARSHPEPDRRHGPHARRRNRDREPDRSGGGAARGLGARRAIGGRGQQGYAK